MSRSIVLDIKLVKYCPQLILLQLCEHLEMIPAVLRYVYRFRPQIMLLPLYEHRHDDVRIVVRAHRPD